MKTVWSIMMDNCLPEHGPHNRHFWFAVHLAKRGYFPVVFVASRERGNAIQMIEGKEPYKVDMSYGFPFVYIRIKDYGESMKKRILAIFEFHKRLMEHADEFAELFGNPDVILGSNGYPLSPWLANRWAKKFNAKSICEICDLWPLSLEEYGIISKGGPIAKAMYQLEKKNYEEADAIIFSMEGGAKYIQDKGWDMAHGGNIDLTKVHHINNGIDLDAFRDNLSKQKGPIHHLEKGEKARIIYAGSLQQINDIGFLLDVADEMRADSIEIVIVGGGDEFESLRSQASRRGLNNIVFTGPISKKEIPSALADATLLILHSVPQGNISKYGMSQNKLFDYLASGKPIISNLPSEFSIINRYSCGVERIFDGPADYAQEIRDMLRSPERMHQWGLNASKTAELYSFARETEKLAEIIESITREDEE